MFFFSLIPEVDTRSFIWSFHPAFSVFVIDMSSLFYHIMFVFHPCAANFSHAVVFHIANKNSQALNHDVGCQKNLPKNIIRVLAPYGW